MKKLKSIFEQDVFLVKNECAIKKFLLRRRKLILILTILKIHSFRI